MELLLAGMNPIVMNAAETVRREMEVWAKQLEIDQGGFSEIEPETLLGGCGIASYLLQRTLARLGVKSTLVMGRYYLDGYACRDLRWEEYVDKDRTNHCWLRVENQIIDLTATQFGAEDRVAVREAGDDRYYVVCEGMKAVRRLFRDWDEQSPTAYPKSMSAMLKQAVKEIRP